MAAATPQERAAAAVQLELELVQTNMAQRPVLRAEVGVRVLRVWSVSREDAWASAGVQGAWVSGFECEADQGVLGVVESEAFFVVVAPPQGLRKAPHGSCICWKQFMMCLEVTWFVHDPGPEGAPMSS